MAQENADGGNDPAFSTDPQSAANAPRVQPVIEPDTLQPIYTNFARVNGSPEELVLDFGLNPQPVGPTLVPVKVSERLVMNYFTAKRLWLALGSAIQLHEQVFGALETDVNKRVIPSAQRR
jgi:hypothetical protein